MIPRKTEQIDHMICNGKRRRQPGRLDPKKVDEPPDAMIVGTLNNKILGGFARRLKLRPDARIAGLNRTILQSRVIFSHRFIEDVRSFRIDVIVDPIDRTGSAPPNRR